MNFRLIRRRSRHGPNRAAPRIPANRAVARDFERLPGFHRWRERKAPLHSHAIGRWRSSAHRADRDQVFRARPEPDSVVTPRVRNFGRLPRRRYSGIVYLEATAPRRASVSNKQNTSSPPGPAPAQRRRRRRRPAGMRVKKSSHEREVIWHRGDARRFARRPAVMTDARSLGHLEGPSHQRIVVNHAMGG